MPLISHNPNVSGNRVSVSTTVSNITQRTFVTRTVKGEVNSNEEMHSDVAALQFDPPGGTQTGAEFVFSGAVDPLLGVEHVTS